MPVPKTDIRFQAVKGFFHLLGRVPAMWACRISAMLGRLWFAIDRRHRGTALDNLNHAFGSEKNPREIRRLARQVFNNMVRIVFEIGWSLHLDPGEFSRFFRISGLENVKKCSKNGRGILVLTGHLGNWELMPVVSAITTHTANVLYRPMDSAPLDRFFVQNRSRFGAKMIPKNTSLLRVFKALKRGESVVMLLDQNVGWRRGVFVNFFGRLACTSYGLAFIALKTGAPVVPIFVIREGQAFKIEIGPQVPLVRTGDLSRDLEANTQEYNNVLEKYIRRYPDQWFWVHNRWKTQPKTSQTRKDHV